MEEEYRGLGSEGWTVRLPVMVGVIFCLLSIPYVSHFQELSRDKNNIFIMVYILINYLPLVIHGILDSLVQFAPRANEIYTSYGFTIFFCLMFWVAMAFIAGELIDRTRESAEASENEDRDDAGVLAVEQDS